MVLATGITPRKVDFPGADHAKVVSYLDVLLGRVEVGASAAIIGGGIGFDVGEFQSRESPPSTRSAGWPNGAWTAPSRPAAHWPAGG